MTKKLQLLFLAITLFTLGCNKKCYINGIPVSFDHCNPKILGKELYSVFNAKGSQFNDDARILLAKYSKSISSSLICTHGTLTDEQLSFAKDYFLQLNAAITRRAKEDNKIISEEGIIKSLNNWGYIGEISEKTKAAYEVIKIKTKKFFNIK